MKEALLAIAVIVGLWLATGYGGKAFMESLVPDADGTAPTHIVLPTVEPLELDTSWITGDEPGVVIARSR